MPISDDQLIDILTKIKVLDEKKIATTKDYMAHNEIGLQEALLEQDLIEDEQLGIAIANFLKVPFVNLSKISIPPDVSHIVPERVARKHSALAFARDDKGIKLAMADPTDKILIESIAHKTQMPVTVHFATQRDIQNAFHLYKKNPQIAFKELLSNAGIDDIEKAKNIPVAKIVDMILTTAYYDNVSDVHIEPQEEGSVVRYRLDGMLKEVLTYPKLLHDRILTRLKVMARLRTDEHLAPQDGKIRISVDDGNLDLRLSIIPIVEGEKAVLRLLASRNRSITLSDLGMSEEDLKKVTHSYNKSFGMILSTGPTGSGKSTSIYSILKVLNVRTKNITTIEDPVEYRLKGVNQIQVNTKANLTFASGLRSILRQDPNIILVGEIRDKETANIAVNAALTGHLVVSTLHTNDAATALPRLIDMDIEPFLVSSTVNIIIAQRLVRKICEMCKTSYEITIEEIKKNFSPDIIKKYFDKKKTVRAYKGTGCNICHHTGYRGRIGIFEVLETSKEIRKLILQKNDSDVIVTQAQKEGMTLMLEDGIRKVIDGVTSFEEILRVTKTESV
ncbi:type II/IV secretion system protein [Candidatus Woesebacteria bacterium]|nr:type II/IV secretion system protein [Candidatus Woesebacteria bacterium]